MRGQKRPKVIIIGAGVGGVATAARLAHAGCEVEVYEKNDFSGGRCSLVHWEGYRFDQGPSLLLLPPLFKQLYSDLETELEDHIDLIQCHPNYVIHYHDGETATLSTDRAQLREEVERWEGEGGGERVDGFLREAGIHADISYKHVLSKPFPSILSLLRPAVLWNLAALHPFYSLYGRCARYFRTEGMRRAFSFGSMYLGSSPFDSPGTYSLLQWTETCEGIWYPRGGFHTVPSSLLSIAQSHGAKVHYSSPVQSVLHDPTTKKARGVRLENGEEKLADVVVVNADLVWAHGHLFDSDGGVSRSVNGGVAGQKARGKGKGKAQDVNPETNVPRKMLDPTLAERLKKKPHSCSSISFYWAMNSTIPSLKAHNIFLAEDYKGSFDDIFKRHSLPQEASFYVNVPSRIDPSAAPDGRDAVVVLVPVGHLTGDSLRTGSTSSQDWPSLVDRARSQVISTMETRLGIKGLRKKILWEGVNTPQTWKEKFNLTHGSILGITHDFFNVLSFRPQARHPSLKSVYFVGASAHPGTGVPIAIAGSRLCAEAVLSDLGIPLPASYSSKPPVPDSLLHVRNPRHPLHILESFLSATLPYIFTCLLTIATIAAWAWYTDRLFPKTIIVYQIPQQSPVGINLDMKSPVVLGGSLVVTLLSAGLLWRLPSGY